MSEQTITLPKEVYEKLVSDLEKARRQCRDYMPGCPEAEAALKHVRQQMAQNGYDLTQQLAEAQRELEQEGVRLQKAHEARLKMLAERDAALAEVGSLNGEIGKLRRELRGRIDPQDIVRGKRYREAMVKKGVVSPTVEVLAMDIWLELYEQVQVGGVEFKGTIKDAMYEACDLIRGLNTECEKEAADAARLRRALVKYGVHKDDCKVRPGPICLAEDDCGCTCGFSEP